MLYLIGTNFRYCPIEVRGRLSFSKNRLKEALTNLVSYKGIGAGVILSTCNRVELYVSIKDLKISKEGLINFLSRFHRINKEIFYSYLYFYQGKEVIKHLFSVACGLDSLILGETQILGQVRSAIQESSEINCTDRYLKLVFDAAVTFARKVHQTTEISKGRVSIGSVTIDFIKERTGTLSGKKILIIGVGKVTELVLKYLQEEGPQVIFISNRNFEKAKQLASQIKQEAVRFDELKKLLRYADIVISATASPHFIIKKETLEGKIPYKLLIIDLAIPKDVDPGVQEIEGIELFNLEDVSRISQKNLEKKINEAEKIRLLINQEVENLWQKLIKLEPEPVLLH
ncbi:MAG: glutamyl-tRNA reductase [Actinobacteria bacterium]|nr:glutamyl-tRNA reductase [Actinomycetota bacterium]